MQQLKKEADDNPFLKDAMEGIDQLSSVQRDTSISELESRLDKRINKKNNRVQKMPWMKLAAGLALLLSVGFYIWRPINESAISSSAKSEADHTTSIESREKTQVDINLSEKTNTVIVEKTSDIVVQIPTDAGETNKKTETNAPNTSFAQVEAERVYPGDDVTFDVTVYNRGSVSSSDVDVREMMPENLNLEESEQIAVTSPPSPDRQDSEAYKENLVQAESATIDGIAIEGNLIPESDGVKIDKANAEEQKEKARAELEQSNAKKNLDMNSDIAMSKRNQQNTNRQIQGIITDENGEFLIGASVVEAGTKNGTITDIEGRYTLSLEGDAESLVISYTGFETQEILLGDEDMVDVSLESGPELSEVVVTALGKRKQSDINQNSFSDYPIGGNSAFKKYLENNLIYPTQASENNIKGKVVLLFEVNASGRPYNIEVKKSLGFGCDEEAIRLLKEGPDWNKGNRVGKTRLAVRFK